MIIPHPIFHLDAWLAVGLQRQLTSTSSPSRVRLWLDVVKQLHSGRAPGDRICPKFLGVLELSWLTHLSNITWRSTRLPLDWHAGVVVPIFEKMGPGDVLQLQGESQSSASMGKVYPKVLERRVHSLVKPWIQEEQCSFLPGCGTLDQLSILPRLLEGAWEFG